jgi:polysaccharide export outer membrane protein
MIQFPNAHGLLRERRTVLRWPFLMGMFLAVTLLAAVTGCQTGGTEPRFKDLKELSDQSSGGPNTNQPAATHSETVALREGDTLKISFLGAPNLNTTVAIRPDGKIDLYLVGEVTAAGLTPGELEKELKKRYKDQIIVNEITVAVESYTFTIYVSGSVMHPQKVLSNHPITILEAMMEAGGPDYAKANLKAVTVLRQDAGQVRKIILNLKDVLSGKSKEQFYLKDKDVIYVREKFSWF